MATDISNLLTRRSNILAELAALTSTASGGKPTYTIDGQTVDHVGYRTSLYQELQFINEQIAIAEGPYEELAQATT